MLNLRHRDGESEPKTWEVTMNATTEIASITTLIDDTAAQTITNYVGDAADDFDIEASAENLRAEIAALAPAGYRLAGDHIFVEIDGQSDEGLDEWRAAVADIDMTACLVDIAA